MSLEETADSIEKEFGVWGGVGPSNHTLDEGPDPPRGMGSFGGGQWAYIAMTRHARRISASFTRGLRVSCVAFSARTLNAQLHV